MRVLTQTSRQIRTTTLLYYACFVMLGLVAASIGPNLPYLATNTKSTLQAVSILLAARASGGLLGALFGARLYDYLSGHHLIAIVFWGLAGCLLLIPFLPLLWVLAVCIFALGIFQSVIDTGTNTLLVWLHKDKVAPFMNGLHFAFGLGAFLMPIVIAQSTLYLGSSAWAFVLIAFLALPLSLSFWRTASPPRLESQASYADTGSKLTLVVLIAIFLFFMQVSKSVLAIGFIVTPSSAT
jgi:MFS family permease